MIHRRRFAMSLPAGAQELYRWLTDVARLREWLPGVARARVLIREGDIQVVEFEAPGLAGAPATFELVLSPARRLDWRQVGTLGERGLSGTLSLHPAADGGLETRVVGELRLRLPWHRWRAGGALSRALEQALAALRAAAGHRLPAGHAARRKILEVRRHGDRLEVWYQGRRYSAPLEGTGPLL